MIVFCVVIQKPSKAAFVGVSEPKLSPPSSGTTFVASLSHVLGQFARLFSLVHRLIDSAPLLKLA